MEQTQTPNPQEIINEVPSAEVLALQQAPAEVAAQAPLLVGERQVGNVPLPNGNVLVSEVTADGMKQERVASSRPSGPVYKNAAEFYDKKQANADAFEDVHGVRPAGSPPRIEAAKAVDQHSKVGGFLAKLLRRK